MARKKNEEVKVKDSKEKVTKKEKKEKKEDDAKEVKKTKEKKVKKKDAKEEMKENEGEVKGKKMTAKKKEKEEKAIEEEILEELKTRKEKREKRAMEKAKEKEKEIEDKTEVRKKKVNIKKEKLEEEEEEEKSKSKAKAKRKTKQVSSSPSPSLPFSSPVEVISSSSLPLTEVDTSSLPLAEVDTSSSLPLSAIGTSSSLPLSDFNSPISSLPVEVSTNSSSSLPLLEIDTSSSLSLSEVELPSSSSPSIEVETSSLPSEVEVSSTTPPVEVEVGTSSPPSLPLSEGKNLLSTSPIVDSSSTLLLSNLDSSSPLPLSPLSETLQETTSSSLFLFETDAETTSLPLSDSVEEATSPSLLSSNVTVEESVSPFLPLVEGRSDPSFPLSEIVEERRTSSISPSSSLPVYEAVEEKPSSLPISTTPPFSSSESTEERTPPSLIHSEEVEVNPTSSLPPLADNTYYPLSSENGASSSSSSFSNQVQVEETPSSPPVVEEDSSSLLESSIEVEKSPSLPLSEEPRSPASSFPSESTSAFLSSSLVVEEESPSDSHPLFDYVGERASDSLLSEPSSASLHPSDTETRLSSPSTSSSLPHPDKTGAEVVSYPPSSPSFDSVGKMEENSYVSLLSPPVSMEDALSSPVLLLADDGFSSPASLPSSKSIAGAESTSCSLHFEEVERIVLPSLPSPESIEVTSSDASLHPSETAKGDTSSPLLLSSGKVEVSTYPSSTFTPSSLPSSDYDQVERVSPSLSLVSSPEVVTVSLSTSPLPSSLAHSSLVIPVISHSLPFKPISVSSSPSYFPFQREIQTEAHRVPLQSYGGGHLHLQRFFPSTSSSSSFSSSSSVSLPSLESTLNDKVLLLHGAVENGRIFYSKKGNGSERGLAPFLARQGFDVYVADFRGKGQSSQTSQMAIKHARFGQTEMIKEEIPALSRYITNLAEKELGMSRVTSVKTCQHWVTHSWGGVLANSTLARFPEFSDSGIVRSMTHLGTKRTVHAITWSRVFLIDLAWKSLGPLLLTSLGYLPAKSVGIPRLFRMGSDHESKKSYRQIAEWVKEGSQWKDPEDGFHYGEALKNREKGRGLPPTFYLAGARDRALGHPADVWRFLKESHPNVDFDLTQMKMGTGSKFPFPDLDNYDALEELSELKREERERHGLLTWKERNEYPLFAEGRGRREGQEKGREEEVKFQVAGTPEHLHDYGHIDIVTHPDAPKDHFSNIADWIRKYSK